MIGRPLTIEPPTLPYCTLRPVVSPRSGSTFLLALALCSVGAMELHAQWTQFRGPNGQGHSPSRSLPVTWSESEHVAWKVPIPGLGHSSPVLIDDQIWLTSAVSSGHSLRAI